MVKKSLLLTAAASLALLALGQTAAEGQETSTIESTTNVEQEKRTLMIYDENHIIQLGKHNHQEFFDMAQELENSTTVVLVYAPWCQISSEFMLEYQALAKHFYKLGELTREIFFAKIDGDKEQALATHYQIETYPALFVQKFENGNAGELLVFQGNRTFKEVYQFIREAKPIQPERIQTKERLEQLRNQLTHHLTVGLLFDKAPQIAAVVERSIFDMQSKNPQMRFALIEDSSIVPMSVVMNAVSPIILIRHPIFENLTSYYEDVIITHREDGTSINVDETVQNIKNIFKRDRFDIIDSLNADQFPLSEKPLVAIAVNHLSVNQMGDKNLKTYQALAKFLFEAGVQKYPEYNFAIINVLEIKKISQDFQLEQYHADRKFFLVILQDSEVGYLQESALISENTKESIDTKAIIGKFIKDFRDGKLHAYLKTETIDVTPDIRDGILRVYGSNFISLVKERKYAPAEAVKGLILMFTRANCPQCDWTEAYFDRLAADFGEEDFQFATMDVDQNSPTQDIKQFLTNPDEPMLQFIAVLPDGGRINRFQKEDDTYEDLYNFVQNIKYLVVHQKKAKGFYKDENGEQTQEEAAGEKETENDNGDL